MVETQREAIGSGRTNASYVLRGRKTRENLVGGREAMHLAPSPWRVGETKLGGWGTEVGGEAGRQVGEPKLGLRGPVKPS